MLAWSWLFWGASVVASGDEGAVGSPLFLLGGAAPFLFAVAWTHGREARAVQRDFWRRVVDPRPLLGRWGVLALGLHPAIVALAVASDALLLGGSGPASEAPARTLGGLLSLLFFVFWFGPLPEEIGWRGFALDRLQARLGPLGASLVLGSVWALWHVPLFFVPGSFQEGLGAGSLRFWIFLATLLPLSLLMTWVYDHTERSTLSAVAIHYTGNLTGAFVAKSDRLAALELLFLILAALAVWWSGRLGGPLRTAPTLRSDAAP